MERYMERVPFAASRLTHEDGRVPLDVPLDLITLWRRRDLPICAVPTTGRVVPLDSPRNYGLGFESTLPAIERSMAGT
jgi:hypothetical protein